MCPTDAGISSLLCVGRPEGMFLGQAVILGVVYRNTLEGSPVGLGAVITALCACSNETSSLSLS